jgi:hypothetical protein
MEKRYSTGAAIGTSVLLFSAILIAYRPALEGGLPWDGDYVTTGVRVASRNLEALVYSTARPLRPAPIRTTVRTFVQKESLDLLWTYH